MNQNMSLLETVLRTSNAYQFLETFRNNGIEAATLPLLRESDLKILGIQDEEIRKSIIKNSTKLQIPCE